VVYWVLITQGKNKRGEIKMAKIQDIRHKTAPSKTSRKISTITHIARHHSATTSGDYFAFWNNRWKGLGWTKGGYNEIILRDGTVQICYSAEHPTNGIKDHNISTYHICLVGNGSFTEAQEKAFKERFEFNSKRFNLSVDKLLGHNEFKGAKTSCPAINMNKVRESLKNPATKYINYTVKKGDTLSKIIGTSDRNKLQEIVTLNKLKNANTISIGQVLKIPVELVK